jgi:hypothetical protein
MVSRPTSRRRRRSLSPGEVSSDGASTHWLDDDEENEDDDSHFDDDDDDEGSLDRLSGDLDDNDSSEKQRQRSNSAGNHHPPPSGRGYAVPSQQHLPHPPPPPPVQMLRVQFGSNLHDVYPSPLSFQEVIVAPALFGHENNSTNFADLRRELEGIVQWCRGDPAWSFASGVAADGITSLAQASRGEAAGSYYQNSDAARHVVQRACRYFSLHEASAAVRISYRRGKPPCRYAGDALYVQYESKMRKTGASSSLVRSLTLLRPSSP